MGCNHSFTFLSRADWYTKNKYSKTALLVDHIGYDAPFWGGCDDQNLTRIYGEPIKRIPLRKGLILWVYNYDVRKKLILDS
jgi:hypothetical protein